MPRETLQKFSEAIGVDFDTELKNTLIAQFKSSLTEAVEIFSTYALKNQEIQKIIVS